MINFNKRLFSWTNRIAAHIALRLISWTDRYFSKKIVLFFCFIGFFLVAVTLLDPDFPWHLRFGSEILTSGINYTDQYSYTMPSFRFVDHSWVMSTLFAFIYNNLHTGYIGVALLCSTLATIAVLIASGQILWLIPLVAASSLEVFGVRTNVVTFLLLPILFLLLNSQNREKKAKLYVLPLFFLLWANVHGGFILGLLYLWGYVLFDIVIIQRHEYSFSENIRLVSIATLSTLTTFVTPYFIGTWQEVLRTIGNPLQNKYIAEWQPPTTLPSFAFIFIIGFFTLSLWYRKMVKWHDIFTLFLFISGLLSLRMVGLFAVSASFGIRDGYTKFLEQKRYLIDKKKFRQVSAGLLFISLLILLLDIVLNVRAHILTMQDFYPYGATEYLQKNIPRGNVFSIMHWSDYLEWQLPQKKVFLDGRMVAWSQEPKQSELTSAIETYVEITKGNALSATVFDQFCVDTILWTNQQQISTWMRSVTPIDITKLLDKFEWKLSYSDYNSLIYQRLLPKNCNSR